MADERKTNGQNDFDEDIDIMMKRRKEENVKKTSAAPPSHGNAAFYERAAHSVHQADAEKRGGGMPPRTNASFEPHKNPKLNDAPNNPRTARMAPPQNQPGIKRANEPNMQPNGLGKAEERSAASFMTSNSAVRKESAPGRDAAFEDNAATKKTDIPGKISKDAKKTKKKETPAEIGSSIVTGMLRTVIYIAVVTVIAAILSVFIINVGNDVYAFVKSDEAIDVTIPENATSDDIADILYENGVIKYKGFFKLYGKIKKMPETYVAGDYTVTPMMNYKKLYYEFREKPVSGTTWVTIPEGYTVDEVIDLMLSKGIGGSREDYVEAINNYEYDYWFVKELDDNKNDDRFYRLEGYLFPDTYEFYNASDAVAVVDKFLKRFERVYSDVYKARADELGLTTEQVVILASMIEKEAGMSSDYRNVSSVFHNRLNNPSTYPRMESDATVVYAIHHLTGERPNDVTGETISFESPYNTYQNNGLPPGAIANPGMNALKYALYPAETNYYYFVSSDDGVTLFASNLAGHEANKAKIKK